MFIILLALIPAAKRRCFTSRKVFASKPLNARSLILGGAAQANKEPHFPS
jgi:hypothetical protein